MTDGARRDAAGLLPDDAATVALGAAIAPALAPGDVVFLIGEMGAGKSALARAILQTRLAAEHRAEETPSPTYTLIQTYEFDSLTIAHADLYRLGDASEAAEIGLLDGDPNAALMIEWPDRLGDAAPPRRLEIVLDIPPDGVGRSFRARAVGPGWDRAFAAIEHALSGAGGHEALASGPSAVEDRMDD